MAFGVKNYLLGHSGADIISFLLAGGKSAALMNR